MRDHIRFGSTAEQLGSEDAALRLAGVYSLATLADESPNLRPAVVQLMCPYLRMNRAHDLPVQQTILEVIADHTRSRSDRATSWSNFSFDLHGVTIFGDLMWGGCGFKAAVDLSDTTIHGEVAFILTSLKGTPTSETPTSTNRLSPN
jgi:hypothetical protein